MEIPHRWPASQERTLRLIVAGSAFLSVAGTCVVLASVVRFRELSKRFFAIQLITYLAVTDGIASLFNILGAFVEPAVASADSAEQGAPALSLCGIQAVGQLYFNLASIFWTSCFALTLYRDMIPSSYARGPLRKYEFYFHLMCWPLPALLAGVTFGLGDAVSYCAVGPAYSPQYLLSFYLPLLGAFVFSVGTYALVWRRATSRRVSRATSLYLLAFGIVWLPSLLVRAQAMLGLAPAFPLAVLEAVCMPLQGALNAAVYGWSLPRIRDMYRTMLLGTDSLDAASILRRAPSEYSPPTSLALSG